MRIHLNEGGTGSGNHGHSGRPGLVGGSSNDFPTSSSATTRKKFAKDVKDVYENDPEFKDMADGLAWYSQGFFDSYISAANSKDFDEYRRKEALLRGESSEVTDVTVGFSGLARVNDIFGNPIKPGKIKASDVWKHTRAIGNYIDNSKESNTIIYRGSHEDLSDLQYAAQEPDRYGNIPKNKFPRRPGKDGYEFEKSAFGSQVSRYHHREKLRDLFTVGKINKISLLSFSNTPETALKFAWGEGGRGVRKIGENERGYLIRIVGKHKGLNISMFSPWNQQEVLVRGKFKTVAVHTKKTGIPDNLSASYVIDLEQVQ